jgi:hypothetical protein
MRFCIVNEGSLCTCDICIELPALPSCAEGDILCYKRFIEAAMKRASAMMYISPQVVDLEAKVKALDTVIQKLHRDVPLQASHTPWGPVLYAAPQPTVPHYAPRYVIRMREKEYDELAPLGSIADAIDRLLSVYGYYPPAFQLMGMLFVSMVVTSNMPTFVQYAVDVDGLRIPQVKETPVKVKIKAGDLGEVEVNVKMYTGEWAGETTLVAYSVDRATLVESLDKLIKPYLAIESAAVVMSKTLANVAGFEASYLLYVRAINTAYATYFGKHKIEHAVGYVVNQTAVPVEIRSVIAAMLSSARNVFAAEHLEKQVTPVEIEWPY